MEPDKFCSYLRESLGPDYQVHIIDILRRYRIINYEPITLRLKSQFEPAQFVGMDPSGPRYFYLKASSEAPSDYAGSYIRFATIRFFAEQWFLEYQNCLSNAIRANYLSLFTLYPAELRKIAHRYGKYFRWEDARLIEGDRAIAGRMIILDPNFSWTSLELARHDPPDPYQYSEDDLPLLPKNLPEEPPKVRIEVPKEIRRQEYKDAVQNEDEIIDFSEIKDA